MNLIQHHIKSVEVFNDIRNPEEIAEFYSPDAVLFDPLSPRYPKPYKGRDEVIQNYEAMYQSYPDIKVESLNQAVNGNLIAYELMISGTNSGPLETPDGSIPATNRTVEMRVVVFAEADENGLYKHVRRYADFPVLMNQLGLN